jgi:crotonobetainyl-CoA:carnitine CoA-transferase CaiB-like acyl-CoA transferase
MTHADGSETHPNSSESHADGSGTHPNSSESHADGSETHPNSSESHGPAGGGKSLEGVTVLDLSTFVTGGFCSAMLANQGAEVVKIEQPGYGDAVRHPGPPFIKGESPYYWSLSYGKKSLELDLKNEDAKEALYELVEQADIFIQNFRPGTAERLDVDYETMTEHNEDLIYLAISAFGQTGPWRERSGYDLLIQGMSGIMSVTGEADR